MTTDYKPKLYEQLVRLYGPSKAERILEDIREGRPVDAGLPVIASQTKPSDAPRPYSKPISPQINMARPQNFCFDRKPMKRRYPSS